MTATGVQRWEQPALASGNRDVVDGWAVQLAGVARLAEYIAATDFVPKAYRDQPAAVAAAILAGREMGIGPMTALQHLYVVEGRPAMSAQLMRALVMAAGHTFRVVESTSARCTVVGRRRGETVDREPVTWSGDEVRRAGLANRAMWQKYPRQMLLARATAELCRAIFPDVLGGMMYALEEAADMPADGDQLPEAAPAKTAARTVRRSATPQQPASPPQITSVADDAAVPLADPSPSKGGPSHHLPPLPDDVPAPPKVGDPINPAYPPAGNWPEGSDQPDAAADDGAAAGSPVAPVSDDGAEDQATHAQRGKLFALLGDLGAMAPRARRINVVSALIGRSIESMSQLTRAEATPLIDVLVRVTASPDPSDTLDALVAQGTARMVLGASRVDEDQPADVDQADDVDQPALLDTP